MKTIRSRGLYTDINSDINSNFTELGQFGKQANMYQSLQRIPSFFKGLNTFTAYDRFVFGSYTDVHQYFTRLMGFQRFVNIISSYVKCNIVQGDIIGESNTKANALSICQGFAELTLGFDVDTLPCIGNHDINAYYGNSVNLVLSKQEQRDNILNLAMAKTENTVFPSTSVCYYYKDYVTSSYKIRVIVLDQYETPETSTGGIYEYTMYQSKHYSNTQLNWLCNTALNLPDSDYHVILVNHEGLSSPSTYNDSYLVLKEIIDAFAIQGTVSMSDNTNNFEYNVVADFSSINGFNGNFVMCLYGHIHEPDVSKITINGRQYNNIRTIATGKVYGYNKYENTGTEESASILIVDTMLKRIFILRYGNPCDFNGNGLPFGDYGIDVEITY